MQEHKFLDTDTKTWISRHVLLSVSFFSNLIEQPNVLCNTNPAVFVESFFDALDGLAAQSKAQIFFQFSKIEISVKIKFSRTFSTPNQRRYRKEPVLEFEVGSIEEEEQEVSTQFLQTQENQLIDLQDHLEHYCSVSPVSGFNSAKHDKNLTKSYLLPLLVKERRIQPQVIKNDNQFVSFNSADVQLLDIINFLRGATGFDSFLKTYKT